MSGWREQAAEKLNGEVKNVTGRKETVMKDDVKNALLEFCRQDEEFAQAVVQGGSFPDCMKAVADGVGSSVSDLEAYRKAVAFYFPGADIQMTMQIDLCAGVNGAAVDESGGAGSIRLNLNDFL